MNRKVAIITFLILIIAGTATFLILVKKSALYASKEDCEQSTERECYLFQDLCQVEEAQNQNVSDVNDKAVRDCLSKVGTWQPTETLLPPVEAPQNQDVQVYQSGTYGFQVEYPKTWEATEETKRSPQQATGADGDELQKVTFLEKDSKLWQADFVIRVLPNPKNLSIKQWRETQLQTSDGEKDVCKKANPESPCLSARDLQLNEEMITINKFPALRISIFDFDHNLECTQVTKNKFVYDLCYDASNPNDPDFDKHQKITSDILASFKFLNEN
jgi:hypothetical protein